MVIFHEINQPFLKTPMTMETPAAYIPIGSPWNTQKKSAHTRHLFGHPTLKGSEASLLGLHGIFHGDFPWDFHGDFESDSTKKKGETKHTNVVYSVCPFVCSSSGCSAFCSIVFLSFVFRFVFLVSWKSAIMILPTLQSFIYSYGAPNWKQTMISLGRGLNSACIPSLVLTSIPQKTWCWFTCNCCNSFNADSDETRSSSASISCLNSIFSYSVRALLRSTDSNWKAKWGIQLQWKPGSQNHIHPSYTVSNLCHLLL